MSKVIESPLLSVDHHQAQLLICENEAKEIRKLLKEYDQQDPGAIYTTALTRYERLIDFHTTEISKLREQEQQLRELKKGGSDAL
jgi:hypothetical protein